MIDNVAYYDTHAEVFSRETFGLNLENRYCPFLSRIPEGGAILDAGCGTGRDSKAFSVRGYRVTAFDASVAMVNVAKEYTGLPIHLMRFNEMEYIEEFDGIWACASLVHVPPSEMQSVMLRFIAALKHGGTWFVSFKFGSGEVVRKGSSESNEGTRTFTNHTEESFRRLLSHFSSIEIVDLALTDDLGSNRNGERWLSAILIKTLSSTPATHSS